MTFVTELKRWLGNSGTPWRFYPAPEAVRARASGGPGRPSAPLRRPGAAKTDRVRELLAREGVANDPGPYAAHKDDSSPTRHHLIASSRVNGVEVVGKDGNRAGRIRELSIEKKSGRVAYALVGTGGFLGFGERIYPVPWSLLSYDPKEEGYRVPFEKSAIIGAPTLTSEDLEWFGAGDEAWRLKTASYYNSYAQIPF